MKTTAALALAALPALAGAAPIPFAQYIKIFTGMAEAEVIDIAGPPDYRSDGPTTMTRRPDGSRVYSRRYTLSWRAGGVTPYTTHIVFRDGVVEEIRRDKQF
ncbi:hypothetical protein [Crenobacter luteus]|uniref:DUF2845 domain-containing protein n=1 Tax=Crenobacter luteus TaxID=1452487 RepID=A0A165F6A0_9NEIS|nr:hypothetical protein [Crenobacter luteus]KZE31669.1 hypothetical protein AVW16_00330 [Crenobacter luteus]